jgi:hypothetical protein
LRFTLETREGVGVSRDFWREKLQGNKAVQPGVFRLVDNAHPTTANLFDNTVVRNGLPKKGVSAGHALAMLGFPPRQVNEAK